MLLYTQKPNFEPSVKLISMLTVGLADVYQLVSGCVPLEITPGATCGQVRELPCLRVERWEVCGYCAQ